MKENGLLDCSQREKRSSTQNSNNGGTLVIRRAVSDSPSLRYADMPIGLYVVYAIDRMSGSKAIAQTDNGPP